jgi:hypothetical protein
MTSSNQDISDCDSELGSDSLNSSHAASTKTTAQRKRVRHRFSVWSFQSTISADATALNGGRASDSVTLQEQQKFLLEHVQSRILHTTGVPGIVTFVEAFYDSSILSRLSGPNIAGSSISIPLHGFVQTRAQTCCELTTMQYWIPASWTPVPGGLASNKGYKDLVHRSRDPNDTLASMCVFGGLSLNNPARAEKKQMRDVSHLHSAIISMFNQQ